jgi:protein O-mannosyl-transferase
VKKSQLPPPRGGKQQHEAPVAAPRGAWQGHAIRIAALWVLSLAAYSNSFSGGLVFDGERAIARDPRIRALTAENVGRILTGGYWVAQPAAGLYRPLTTLSFLANYAVLGNGTGPGGYHAVNFLLHGLNVTLVYLFGLAIFSEALWALPLAALWGLHPLLTEAVANIAGRADLLAAFGVLAGLLCYSRALEAAGRRRIAWLAAMAAAQAIGLFSKESAVVLPLLMLLWDVTWTRPTKWRERASAYAVLAVPYVVFFILRAQSPTQMLVPFLDNPLVSAPFWAARLTAIQVIGKFAGLFVWPAGLSADYSYNAIPVATWHDASALIALALCVGSVLALLPLRRAHRSLFFFLSFFFIALLPTANLVMLIGSIMAERFVYLPSVGLAGCAVAGVQALSRRFGKAVPANAWAALGVACLALGARTYTRNFDWKDEASLWSSAAATYPQSAKAHLNLGEAWSQIPGRLPDSIAEYRAALKIEPGYAQARYNLGTALLKMPGRAPEAVTELEAALLSRPDYAEAHNNLGKALAQTGRLTDAVVEYQAALRGQPDYAEAHNNLGNALAQLPGRLPEAMSEYESAIQSAPDLAEAHYDLANVLAQTGRLADAVVEYKMAVRAEPDYAEAHNNLGNALAQLPGELPEAISEFESAIRLRPDYADAHYNLGVALTQIPGRLPDAIDHLGSAVRINPEMAQAHYNLGVALSRVPGGLPQAIAELEAALRIRPDPRLRQMVEQLRAGNRK